VKKDYYDDIRLFSIRHKIPFFNRHEHFYEKVPYKIAVGWRWMIPDIDGLIVLHDSILPRYRGFAPLVNSLINGENQIGVTALFANESFDKGDIIEQQKVNIAYPIKIEKAIEIVASLYSHVILSLFKQFENDIINSYKQDETKATYSLWRDNEDYFIDWRWDAKKIKRFVDAVGFPYKGAKTWVAKDIITISEVEVIPDLNIENRDVGKVLYKDENFPVVVCGKGLIKIISMTLENGNPFILKKFRTRFKQYQG
jgi:methionyl-tRNA formyltransferase